MKFLILVTVLLLVVGAESSLKSIFPDWGKALKVYDDSDNADKVCSQPKDPGPCRASIPRWYFNIETGKCEGFTYGGCNGNENNFETITECEKKCGNQGYGVSDSGSRKPYQYKWYFDAKCKTCKRCISCECPKKKRLYSCKKDCFEAKICRDNQHYEECGTACPLTCENCKNPPKFCLMMCVEGCFCNEGYVKTKDGRCVLPKHCPQKICTAKPERGPGITHMNWWYYNSNTGKCNTFDYGGFGGNGNRFNTKEACMKTCGKVCTGNQTYLDCGTNSPLTCDNYKDPPVCLDRCVKGCFCINKEFVRNQTGHCVRTKDCPIKCDKNEVYKHCGPACPSTCENFHDPPKGCTKQCVRGCFCKDGFVKNCKGQCVKPCECPSYDQSLKQTSSEYTDSDYDSDLEYYDTYGAFI